MSAKSALRKRRHLPYLDVCRALFKRAQSANLGEEGDEESFCAQKAEGIK